MRIQLEPWVGETVRLRRTMTTRSGFVHGEGTELRVVGHVRGRLHLADPTFERDSWQYKKRELRQVWPNDVSRGLR